MKKCIVFCITALFIVGFTASNEEQNSPSKYIEVNNNINDTSIPVNERFDNKKENSNNKVVSRIKDIEELRQSINNTIWTHTTKGDAWLRYEFVGNKVKQYGALPNCEEWRYDGDSEFTLSEHRSQYDGKKYIVATFYPKTKSLAMFELPVVFNFRDYHLYLNGKDVGGFIMTDYEWD